MYELLPEQGSFFIIINQWMGMLLFYSKRKLKPEKNPSSMTTKTKTQHSLSCLDSCALKFYNNFQKQQQTLKNILFCWRNFIDRKNINSKIQQFPGIFKFVCCWLWWNVANHKTTKHPVLFPLFIRNNQQVEAMHWLDVSLCSW